MMTKMIKLFISFTIALAMAFLFMSNAQRDYTKIQHDLLIQQQKQQQLTKEYVNKIGTVSFKQAKIKSYTNTKYQMTAVSEDTLTTVTVTEKPNIVNGQVTLYRANELSNYHVTKELALHDKTVIHVLNDSGFASNKVKHCLDYVLMACLFFISFVLATSLQTYASLLLDKAKQKKL